MNGEDNIIALLALILFVSVVSVVAMTGFLIQYGVVNDYLFFETQEAIDNLATDGLISTNTSATTLSIFQTFKETINWHDNLWLLVYVAFVISTLFSAYAMKNNDTIPFLTYLLFGVMVFLFIGGLLETFTDWFIDNITARLIPEALEYYPKFSWYLEYMGIINLIHATILLLLTQFNFQFSKSKQIKEQEVSSIQNSDEVF
jgi:ABC-type multidrug transport system fused ATPase/permease subunit